MIPAADLGLLDGFERALINGRLHMCYQPKVSLSDGSLKQLYRDDPAILTCVHRALAGESFTATRELDGRILWVYYQALVDADAAAARAAKAATARAV